MKSVTTMVLVRRYAVKVRHAQAIISAKMGYVFPLNSHIFQYQWHQILPSLRDVLNISTVTEVRHVVTMDGASKLVILSITNAPLNLHVSTGFACSPRARQPA